MACARNMAWKPYQLIARISDHVFETICYNFVFFIFLIISDVTSFLLPAMYLSRSRAFFFSIGALLSVHFYWLFSVPSFSEMLESLSDELRLYFGAEILFIIIYYFNVLLLLLVLKYMLL